MTGEFQTLQKTVAASGTPEKLIADDKVMPESDDVAGIVRVKAMHANTGAIFIGNSSADALKTSNKGYTLLKDEYVDITVANLNQIWIDAATNGEGVEILIR